MPQRLTDSIVKILPSPAKGNVITYDTDVKGFGCRVTANGAKAFILGYRTRAGRERRFTIGQHPDWSVSAAREEAKNLKRRIGIGEDPLAEIEAARDAPTVADLVERFKAEHLPRLRPASRAEYSGLIDNFVLPEFRSLKVRDVSYGDIDRVHRKLSSRAPVRANRLLAITSKMFSLAIKWGYCDANPCRGVERNAEHARTRYLSVDEVARLSAALAAHPDRRSADIIRLLLLCGARLGEVLGMRWDQLDVTEGTWSKPASLTKQKLAHHVPLSAPARQLLSELRAAAPAEAMFVFPSSVTKTGHRNAPYKVWAVVCKAAGVTNLRLHDLRHSFASLLVSGGWSLPIVGALLGHSLPSTTQRYSHVHHDPMRLAVEAVGALVTGQPSAEVHTLKTRRP